jgi:hypothetical protein
MMYKRTVLLVATMSGLSLGSMTASVADTIDCGTNGSVNVVQNAINAIGSTPSSLAVTGSCDGFLTITRADRLTLTGLSLTGILNIDASVLTSLPDLHLKGMLLVTNSRRIRFTNMVMHGQVQVATGSAVSFGGFTQAPWTDDSGELYYGFNCVGQSDCTLANITISGSGNIPTQSIGVLAGSGSRLSVSAGTISGFDIGVQIWNNASGFIGNSSCGNLNIQANRLAGVYVTDSGMVKIDSPTLASTGCTGLVSIADNGSYGVWASGGGNAYLHAIAISGHALDGIRVTNGSTARIRSSSIGAASSGRSATAKGQAHLYFDEQDNGSTASSSLAGSVCVTGNSTVDTDNSSTVLNVVTTCGTP